MPEINEQLAQEAKAIVAMAFRNGPIENVHAGEECPTCDGSRGISRITQEEMKAIMKHGVNKVYELLELRERDPEAFKQMVQIGNMYTHDWDQPELQQLHEI